MASMVFLAAEVETVDDSVRVPLDPNTLVTLLPRAVCYITLRAFDGDLVHVLDFEASTGVVPHLMRWEQRPPTEDDWAYLAALDKYDIRPVDVHGEAYHGE